jgi:uncharacterized membrane protein (DUF2068 family)
MTEISRSSPAPVRDPSGKPHRRRSPGGILPGLLGIAAYLLLVAGALFLQALHQRIFNVRGAAALMLLSFLVLNAALGLALLRRWGWAMASAACVLLLAYYSYVFTRTHQSFVLIGCAANLVFFLYLLRPTVRKRLR